MALPTKASRYVFVSSVTALALALFSACSDDASTADDAGADAAPDTTKAEGGKTDSGEDVAPDRGTGSDASDAQPDHADASSDARDAGSDVTDAGNDASDAGSDVTDAGNDASDAGSDASDAAVLDGGACPSIDGGACTPDGGNFGVCGTAAATSTYSGWPVSRIIDGDLDTSWFAASGACPAYPCLTHNLTVTLNQPRTVGRVRLFGNREFSGGYDVLSARIELLSANDQVLRSYDVTTSRGAEPNGDADQVVSPAVPCVQKVRAIVLDAQADGPGFAELQVLEN